LQACLQGGSLDPYYCILGVLGFNAPCKKAMYKKGPVTTLLQRRHRTLFNASFLTRGVLELIRLSYKAFTAPFYMKPSSSTWIRHILRLPCFHTLSYGSGLQRPPRAQAACSPRACSVGDPAADGRGQSAAIQGRTFRFDATAAAGTDGFEWGGAGGLSLWQPSVRRREGGCRVKLPFADGSALGLLQGRVQTHI